MGATPSDCVAGSSRHSLDPATYYDKIKTACVANMQIPAGFPTVCYAHYIQNKYLLYTAYLQKVQRDVLLNALTTSVVFPLCISKHSNEFSELPIYLANVTITVFTPKGRYSFELFMLINKSEFAFPQRIC